MGRGTLRGTDRALCSFARLLYISSVAPGFTQPPEPPVPPPAPPSAPSASPFYVSNATTSGSGTTVDDPMSLHECVAALSTRVAGTSCLLLTGEYQLNGTVEIRGLHGTSDAPYRIGAAPGHAVTLDGTRDVPGPWIWSVASHTFSDGSTADVSRWVADWPEGWAEPWQLFADGEMQVEQGHPRAYP